MLKTSLQDRINKYFATAREREWIRIKRELGWANENWTDDPIFREYRFCNVFREDDKTTRWVREHVTQEKYGDKIVGATMMARWFNRIETMRHLIAPPGCNAKCDDLCALWAEDMEAWRETMREVLKNEKPLVTGAYMIKTPTGMSKLEGIIWCLERALPQARYDFQLFAQQDYRLQWATEHLTEYPFLGPFMAYQIVCDLKECDVLRAATDRMTWAQVGPGSTRGLGEVWYDDPAHFQRSKPRDVEEMVEIMQTLLMRSQDNHQWPKDWPAWEMSTVQNWSCEYSKYCAAERGERLKRRFSL